MEVYVYIRDAYVYIYSANLEQINEFKYSSESCVESERERERGREREREGEREALLAIRWYTTIVVRCRASAVE